MGTSSAYGGPKGSNPLIPSWLDSGTGGQTNPNADNNISPPGTPNPPNRPAIPPSANSDRFRGTRGSFTRFATSGGSDRSSLGRAISGYVSTSSGGAKTAVQRMGASRGAGARLVGFLADSQANGLREALRHLNLEGLAGRPIDEILVGLSDYICPNSDTIDDGIAREAYIETVVELTELGITDLDSLTPDQMQTVFELYATHAIEARLCNDIGMKLITAPSSAQTALHVQKQLHDFIRNGVSDALTITREENPILTQDHVQSFVDIVYERAFNLLKVLGDMEANQ